MAIWQPCDLVAENYPFLAENYPFLEETNTKLIFDQFPHLAFVYPPTSLFSPLWHRIVSF